MVVEILMPALDPSMTQGRIVKWLKVEGDPVKIGDPIVEVETDKAVVEIEAEAMGTLGKPLVAEGEYAEVNSAIGTILNAEESPSALTKSVGAGSQPPGKPRVQAGPAEISFPVQQGTVRNVPPTAGSQRIFASPLARRLAARAGLDLAGIHGSGPKGRIVKTDIQAALAKIPAPSGRVSQPQVESAAQEFSFLPGYDAIPNSSMRAQIALRLTASCQHVPHYFLNLDCELDKLLALRKDLNEANAETSKVSLNDFIIRAAALALVHVPAANSAWTETAILRFKQVDMSFAVAIEGGLITPVIRNAAEKTVVQISGETQALTTKARNGKLRPEDYKGGTFTISNLGMYGIKSFTSIINPPQGAILSIGAGEQRPVIKDGQFCAATIMTVTLAADHRCIDGAVGAEFLAQFKKLIERPVALLL